MVQVESVFLHAPDAQQRKQLHRLDDDILIAALSLAGGSSIEVATPDEHRAALLGLFGTRDRHGLRRPESAGFLQISHRDGRLQGGLQASGGARCVFRRLLEIKWCP